MGIIKWEKGENHAWNHSKDMKQYVIQFQVVWWRVQNQRELAQNPLKIVSGWRPPVEREIIEEYYGRIWSEEADYLGSEFWHHQLLVVESWEWCCDD